MHARTKTPALIIPAATQAIQDLKAAIGGGGVVPRRSAWSICGRRPLRTA
jgi:hypothetical protein